MSFSAEEIEEFSCEARELLDAAENSLLKISEGLPFAEGYEAIFRCFHNLKGAAGMMEMLKLQAHTHELENFLVSLKDCH